MRANDYIIKARYSIEGEKKCRTDQHLFHGTLVEARELAQKFQDEWTAAGFKNPPRVEIWEVLITGYKCTIR